MHEVIELKYAAPSRTSIAEGSIYQRKDGRWAAKYAPMTGGPVKYLYGKTKGEVTRKLKQYKSSSEVLIRQDVSSVPLTDYVERWLKLYKKPSIKQATYDRLETVLQSQIVPAFKDIPIRSLMIDDYQAFISELADSGVSYAVVRKTYDLLRSCLEQAAKRGDITSNPMNAVVPPAKSKYESKEVRALYPDEEKILFDELFRNYSTGRPVYAYREAFVLMLNTGIREGEMVALDWDDIDMTNKRMHVWKTVITVNNRDKHGVRIQGCHQEVQNTPKTKRGNRTIPLNKAALDALTALKEQNPDHPSILATKTGARPMVSALQKSMKTAGKRCGLSWVSPHTLRHTFASKLLWRKADVKSVSRLLGHSSVSVTWNIYYHLLDTQVEETVALLDDL